MVSSLLGGCTATPAKVRPVVTGPQVYGYPLNQQLSDEQIRRLTDSGKGFVGSLKLYQQVLPDGSQFGFYVDSDYWLEALTRTSRGFDTESECVAAQQADETQLKTLIDDFNVQQARPAGAPREVGDVYVSRALDACQRIGGQGPEAEALRYTLWATMQTATLEPGPGSPRKVETPHSLAGDVVVIVVAGAVLAVVVVAAVAMGGWAGPCVNLTSHKEGEGQCEKDREKERLQRGY
ncbi:hypothetical protein GV819_14190 [Pseudomonas sp. Fl5BN2]|uniref:hypothetical protein n=1 Tax=Pseudomonas sp. Fl5BN2 TaxID=2697652 RepID=UPI001377B727|nr:hypothetical protein [Pseudomonas sp. Fl5BN2]NBF03440.1 hypothetical protein [Pseudomonas sp. Fl5BN2]